MVVLLDLEIDLQMFHLGVPLTLPVLMKSSVKTQLRGSGGA